MRKKGSQQKQKGRTGATPSIARSSWSATFYSCGISSYSLNRGSVGSRGAGNQEALNDPLRGIIRCSSSM